MIMESSADLHDHHHHHQLQELHLLAAPPPLPIISSSVFSTTTSTSNNCFNINAAAWNPNLITSTSHNLIGGGDLNCLSSYDVHNPYGSFHDQWSGTDNAHDNHYSTIHAQEFLPDDFPSTSRRSTSTGRSSHIKQEQDDQKHSPKTFSSSCQLSNGGLGTVLVTDNHGDRHSQQQFAAAGAPLVPMRGGNYSQIFPTTNINSMTSNNIDPCSLSATYNPGTNSSLLGMNSQALDLWGSTSQPAADHPHYSINHLPAAAGFNIIDSTTHCLQQDSIGHHLPASYMSSKQMPSSPYFMNNGVVVVTELAKRCSSNSSSTLDHKLPKSSAHDHLQVAAKKPRTEPRSSFAPFKVRKEKLGDRIAALQQLVAPFGKTDTASVLMEAIGYIKFLHHQVETLSVPYMKSSRSRAHNSAQIQRASYYQNNEQEGSQEAAAKQADLRSRGLCLVPLHCTSYF